MESKSKQKRALRDKKVLREQYNEAYSKMPASKLTAQQPPPQQENPELEFKNFEKLLGEALEKTQNLRKGRQANRDSSNESQDRRERGEYFQTQAKIKRELRSSDSKGIKASILSAAETQLTDSDLYSESKVKDSGSELSYTVEYLLNENKHLKEEIESLLKSRNKQNEVELLTKKISQYRRMASEQQAQIALLKKYNTFLAKESQRYKAQLADRSTRIELLKQELQSIGCSSLESRNSKLVEKDFQVIRGEDIIPYLEKVKTHFRKSQTICDIINCLEKEIYWKNTKDSPKPKSPRRIS